MENTNHSQQTSRFYNLENLVISATSTFTAVPIADITSNGKKKEVALAKSIACNVLHEYGYGVREIARLMNIDHKGVSVYVGSHENRLADRNYTVKYNNVKMFVQDYNNRSVESFVNRVTDLQLQFSKLESTVSHLKELLTSH